MDPIKLCSRDSTSNPLFSRSQHPRVRCGCSHCTPRCPLRAVVEGVAIASRLQPLRSCLGQLRSRAQPAANVALQGAGARAAAPSHPSQPGAHFSPRAAFHVDAVASDAGFACVGHAITLVAGKGSGPWRSTGCECVCVKSTITIVCDRKTNSALYPAGESLLAGPATQSMAMESTP